MIRWTQKTNAQIDKLVEKYNRKIDYHKRKGLKNLPSKITREEIKEGVTDRKELNRKINSYSIFLKRGNEKTITTKSGNEISLYEYKKEKRLYNRREKWKAKKLKEMLNKEVIIDGRKRGYTYSHPYAPKQALAEYQPQKFPLDVKRENKLSKNMWESFVNTFERFFVSDYDRKVNEEYKQNYIKALENNNVSQEIIDIVKNTDCDEVCRLLLENYVEAKIDFIYPIDDMDKNKNQIEIDNRLYNFWIKKERD